MKTTTKTYWTAEDLTPMATDALQTLKNKLQGFYQYNGGTLGEMGNARGSVKRINVILRERGALKDAKGLALTKDQTGFVAAAVKPLKDAAVAHAKAQAVAYVERVATMFAGKNLNDVAPSPNSRTMGRDEYRKAAAKRAAIVDVLAVRYAAKVGFRSENTPAILERDADREAKFVAAEAVAAGLSFDAYVAKLEGKVGEGVTGATVAGLYLWQGSVLTVQKGKTSERWHTQQIVNYSVLGNAYNQWPTRKMK